MSYASMKYCQDGEKVHEHLVSVARKGETRTLTAANDMAGYPSYGYFTSQPSGLKMGSEGPKT
jgi:hypothetical protein